MSPSTYSAHRRSRSHSSTAGTSHKRAIPTQHSTSKWDVDLWRRGKRPRYNYDQQPMQTDEEPLGDVQAQSSASNTPRLASTSQAFNLFPNNTTPIARFACLEEESLDQLHSDAFNDLRKSIEETGEGFVRRMREFEQNRNRSLSLADGSHPGGWRKPSPPQRAFDHEDPGGCDVDIIYTPPKKRAASLGRANGELPETSALFCDRSSSPDPLSESSAFTSDDEDDDGSGDQNTNMRPKTFRHHPPSTVASTPPLSFTFSNSANSSQISLSLLPASLIPHHNRALPIRFTGKSDDGTPSLYAPSASASRSERAVAALSLALANGAGSLADYQALQAVQGAVTQDDRYAGELWD